MRAKFILIATGNPQLAKIEHCIYDDGADEARDQSHRVVKSLAKAGYYQFDLYDVDNDANPVLMGSFKADFPTEPAISFIPPWMPKD